MVPEGFESLSEAELAKKLVEDGLYDEEAAAYVAALLKGKATATPAVD